jgi:hypothetical protein
MIDSSIPFFMRAAQVKYASFNDSPSIYLASHLLVSLTGVGHGNSNLMVDFHSSQKRANGKSALLRMRSRIFPCSVSRIICTAKQVRITALAAIRAVSGVELSAAEPSWIYSRMEKAWIQVQVLAALAKQIRSYPFALYMPDQAS